ncbi:MAG: DUF2752 domain-containing protein [Bacteroidetes bacterium]|nr:DUF2752 domain-containing protein [Bacteroidota bacterium]
MSSCSRVYASRNYVKGHQEFKAVEKQKKSTREITESAALLEKQAVSPIELDKAAAPEPAKKLNEIVHRAIRHLVHLDFQSAWEFNKLCVIVAPLLLLVGIQEIRKSIKIIRHSRLQKIKAGNSQ